MNNKSIQILVLFGSLVIIGIIAAQAYLFYKTWNLKEREFDETVRIALQKTAKNLADAMQFEVPSIDLVKRVSSNYYVVNVDNVIDANMLEYYLQTELEAMSIAEDFDYGIFNCSSKEMVYGGYCNLSNAPTIKQSSNLPVYDQFTYYFGVRFPHKQGYIWEQMQLATFFGLILLLTICFFAYSIFIVLRQKRLTELQKDFINNMTHEFKTPISTINVSTNVLLQNPMIQENPRLNKYAQIIQEQNSRLNKQVEKVLQIASLEREELTLHREPIDLHETLQRIARNIDIKIQEKNGTLLLQLAEKQIFIYADSLHFYNIVENIIDNAIKYCKDKPSVTIRTREIGKKIKLSIEDEGIGIPTTYQNQIFNKFFRVPTGNLHNVKGFGLGLFYVKNICDAHEWKLTLNSKEGEGTTIALLMPQYKK